MDDSKIIDIKPIVCKANNTIDDMHNTDEKIKSSYTVTLFLKFSNGNTNEVTLLIEDDNVINKEMALAKAKDIIRNEIEFHLIKIDKVQGNFKNKSG